MKIAVLCPGPSLPSVWTADAAKDFGCVIAVNTAGHAYACDWLCGVDKHIIEPVLNGEKRRPGVGLLTCRAWGLAAEALGLRWMRPGLYYGRGVDPGTAKLLKNGVCAYTFPNALQFALELTRDSVHVFGMDFAEVRRDFSGQVGYHEHARWFQEATWLRSLWRDGITVHGSIEPEILEYIACKRAHYP